MFLHESNMLAEVPPFNWSSMLLLQSESFVNLNAFSLQNDAPLVSNIIVILYLNTIGFLKLRACGIV